MLYHECDNTELVQLLIEFHHDYVPWQGTGGEDDVPRPWGEDNKGRVPHGEPNMP